MYCVNDSFTCSNVILNEILEFQKKEQIWRSYSLGQLREQLKRNI